MDVVLGVALGGVVFVADVRIGAAWDDVGARAYDDALTWVTFQLRCKLQYALPRFKHHSSGALPF